MMVAQRTRMYLLGGVGVLFVFLAGAAISHVMLKEKVGFVRSPDLVYKYSGMREAQQAFRDKQDAWTRELDSIQSEFRKAVSTFENDEARMPPTRRAAVGRELQMRRKGVQEYADKLKARSQREDEELTQGILNQINDVVTRYGKEHGYSIIFGTTTAGSLLYGEDALDLTDEILAHLNTTYASQQPTSGSKQKQ